MAPSRARSAWRSCHIVPLLLLVHLADGCGLVRPPQVANACRPRSPLLPRASRQGALSFPSGGAITRVTGDELHDLLLHQARSRDPGARLVVFFYLEDCPNSMAMKPVVECLPAFFPPEVLFVSVEYSDLNLLQLMTNTLHALPVLQVSAQGKRFRYRGRHQLAPLLRFLERTLGREPIAPPAAVPLCAANASLCGGWQCARTDGEATVEELTREASPLLALSALFLAGRGLVWGWKWRRRRLAAQAEGAAAPAALPAAAEAGAGGAGG